jgi:hypothetical protein
MVWGTSVSLGFDADYWDRFEREFRRNRLPGSGWFSLVPTGPLAPVGPASSLVIEGTENIARNEATRNVTTFSASRSFVYISGYKPAYFGVAKSIKIGGIILTVPTMFYTGADIGTIIYSAVNAYGE